MTPFAAIFFGWEQACKFFAVRNFPLWIFFGIIRPVEKKFLPLLMHARMIVVRTLGCYTTICPYTQKVGGGAGAADVIVIG